MLSNVSSNVQINNIVYMYIVGPKKSNTSQRSGILPTPPINICRLGFLDLSNWVLFSTLFVTGDICRVSLVILVCSTTWSFLLSHKQTHTHTHTHTHTMYIDKHLVWHRGCHVFGQALCDIFSVRKNLGWLQQQILWR